MMGTVKQRPNIYTAMMLDFKEEWDALFMKEVQALQFIDGKLITEKEGSLFIGTDKLYFGSRTIIDDVLIWSSYLRLTILFFRCVCMIFQKYRVSFKLKNVNSSKTAQSMLVTTFSPPVTAQINQNLI